MKALVKCSKCRKQLETDCSEGIRNNSSLHICKNGKKESVDINWKLCPETEKDLIEIEER
jgi:hypothetical protein